MKAEKKIPEEGRYFLGGDIFTNKSTSITQLELLVKLPQLTNDIPSNRRSFPQRKDWRTSTWENQWFPSKSFNQQKECMTSFFLQHHISLEGSPALKKKTQNFSGKKNLTNSPRTSKTPPLPRHQLLCSLWYSPIQKRPKATEASWHPEFRAKSHGSTPLKTKMTGWKILIFNKKYIFIHGRCSSQVHLRGISTKRHQLQLCLV